ncbi:DNA helicase-2 / ATP-dependent DNA helicase PcrA [Megamonas sp. Calf98-2]|uniref:3'-5' exonuclease n=1 Tax=Megamonas sp. Calf98-2 TaxID=1855330 RepID=UPI0008B1B313|nr:3'-5' exonuclease [Megamonas sp. Calf98-2]SEN01552.1 DNA helicase-2 / ATP-dependent DNA helicase PcrA [Megamonas sp. Calf98-2]
MSITFNKKQQQVINELNQNILLSAGAGTGKTNVLSYRVANILNKNRANADEILCLTFTNKACRELKNRITSQLDFETANKITIRTIHGFAYQVITTTAKKAQTIFKEFVIFDDEDQKTLIRQTITNFPKTRALDIQYIVNCIEQLKQERALKHIYTEDIEADYTTIYHQHLKFNKTFNQQQNDNLTKFFQFDGLNIIINYELALQQMHGLDYKDLIANAYRLFQDENICSSWRKRYKYIMIDEMQDTSSFEYTMLEKLFPANNIMLCGDEFQTIYEWRGSNPQKILTAFTEKYNPLIINFNENYRSTKLLLEMAYNTLINLFCKETILHSYAKNLLSKSSELGHKIELKQANSLANEAQWIFQNIVNLLPLVKTPTQIAILVRQNNYLQNLTLHLNYLANIYNQKNQEEPIHFIQIDNIRFFKRQEIKDVLSIMKYLINPNDYLSLQRILINLIPNIGIRTIKQISSAEYLQNGLRLSDFINANFQNPNYEPFSDLISAYLSKDIIVFDIEGTGTDIFADNIIQLSAIKIRKGKKIAEFNRYLKSDKPVGDSEKVHHISDKYLQTHGENPKLVLQEFCQFIQDAIITGHNIRGYDMDILNQNLLKHNLKPVNFSNINFDTLDLVRRFYPNLLNHKLEFLSNHFQFETKSNHNSLDDVFATWELLHRLLEDKIIPTAKKRSELINKQKNKFIHVAQIFQKLHNILNDNLLLENLIAQIVEEFNLVNIYKANATQDGAVRLENIRNLFRLAKAELNSHRGTNGIKELLQYASLSNTDLDALTSSHPKIPIITIHQAKGLEFDYEFLAGMNDDIFPSYFSTRNGSITEEEKRLFYVAITRAKKALFLSSSGRPSRLLNYIPEQFITKIK